MGDNRAVQRTVARLDACYDFPYLTQILSKPISKKGRVLEVF